MARRHIDSLRAKEKKQKVVAAVLGAVFLGVMALQGPKLWKQLHPPAPKSALPATATATTATATTATAPSVAVPAPGGTQPTPESTLPGSSLASSAPAAVADGQLTSFSLFTSKDPFVQQLTEGSATTGSSAPPAPSPSPSVSSPSRSSASSAGAGSPTQAGGGAAPLRAPRRVSAPTPKAAVISVNGMLYKVAPGGDFPKRSASDPSIVPLFHLLSLTAHTAKISIAGGSYANGASSVTLRENRPVTLMNTADRTRYRLILKPAGTAVPTASSRTSPPSPTSTTVTLPPPTSP